jgi:hypothetical protein
MSKLWIAIIPFAVACGAQPVDESDAELRALPPAAYQLSDPTPTTDELTFLSLSANGGFGFTRCDDAACTTTDAQSGTYTRSSRYLHFFDASHKLVGAYEYRRPDARTLTLRKIGSHRLFGVAVLDEGLCDSTGGAWHDDDPTPQGLFCDCGADRFWASDGCRDI